MKSFFKKVALLLVLAMVVTMMPSRAVSAAETEGPLMRTSMKLYINGDITETYSEQANAWVSYDHDIYKVAFASEDENVATVNAKGRVTAVGVGRTNVTATFTNQETGDVVTRQCRVDVKRNPLEVSLSDNSKAKLENGIEVGATFQTAVARTNADGDVTWKRVKFTNKAVTWPKGTEEDGAKITTSAIVFESDNEEVFTVDKNGLVTAVGKGEANLSIWAVQSEKPETDEDGNTVYLPVTKVETYTVKVLEGKIEDVKQTTVDSFAITCSSEKTASEITDKNLSVVYVINGAEVIDHVKSVAVSDKDKKVVIVTLYNGITTGRTYRVSYGDDTLEFVGAELVPAEIKITTTVAKKGEDTEVKVAVYNKDGVDITAASESSRITFSADQKPEYYLSGNMIYFFEKDAEAIVTATYAMYWDEQGNKIKDLEDTAKITSYEHSTTNGDISGWLVGKNLSADDAKNEGKFTTTNQFRLAAGDTGYYIYGMYTQTTGTDSKKLYTVGDSSFSFASTNETVLLVDPNTGELCPVAPGTAGIIVTKDNNKVVGVCNFIIVESRIFTTFSVSADKDKLSYADNLDDKITVSLTVKDQLTENIDIGSDNVTIEVPKTSADSVPIVDGKFEDGKVKITANANVDATRTVYVNIKVNVGGVEKAQTVRVTVKKVNINDIYSYKIKASKESIDLKLEEDKLKNNEYRSTITVECYDRDGFYLGTVTDLTNTDKPKDGRYGFVIDNNANVSGTDFVAIDPPSVASGSSELITKPKTGNYMVRVYKGINDKVQLIGSTVINVTDTTGTLTAVQESQKVADINNDDVIFKALTFKRGNDTVNVELKELKATRTPNGQSAFVTTVTVYEVIGAYKWEIVVPVYKLFTNQ